jgi:hypothetical protein
MKIKGRGLPFRAHRDMIVRMSKQFQDHKKGIPEWLKNANDSYYRYGQKGKSCSNLPIILNFSKSEIYCLDFGGADGEIIKKYGLNYGDPTASQQGQQNISGGEGGHGNGGKYYGLAQFDNCELLMYHEEKFSKFIINNERDYEIDLNIKISPEYALRKTGVLDWEYWRTNPNLIKQIQNKKLGFFCWKGIKPKDTKKITNKNSFFKLINSITYNKQALNTIRERQVIILRNGRLVFDDLELPAIEIDKKFEKGWSFDLPGEILGYKFNKQEKSKLIINVSSKTLTNDLSDLNCLDIGSKTQILASYNIPNLTGNRGIAKSLYATITCPELKEYKCIDNDRIHLIDNELSNTFISWCRKKILEVVDEIEQLEKKETDEKELKKVGNFLNEIMEAVSDILEEEDLIKFQRVKNSDTTDTLDIPSGNSEGYGNKNNKIKKKGGGKRSGSPEEKEVPVEQKKGKNKIKILLSDIDDDPLNPGHKVELSERHPILIQRPEDVDYGIWWLNTSKKYLKNFKERNSRTAPFYMFIVKEVVFSQRSRKNFSSKTYNPDDVDGLNFDLIDMIFSRVTEKLGLDISETGDNISEQIRRFILEREEFYIKDITDKFKVQSNYVHTILRQNKKLLDENFTIEKENGSNHYIRKI